MLSMLGQCVSSRGASRYPPAEPGALGIGPLEAANRVADATLHLWPPEGGRSAPQIHLIQAAVLLLLVPDVLAYHRLVPTYRRDEVPSGPEMLPHNISLLLAVYTRQMDGALPLMNPTTCETAYFGGIEIIM